MASDISVAGSAVEDGNLQGPFLIAERNAQGSLCALQRRHSVDVSRASVRREANDARWPRRLSFSVAEDAILAWDDDGMADLATEVGDGYSLDAEAALRLQASKAEMARLLHLHMVALRQDVGPWVGEKMEALEALADIYAHQQDDVQNLYFQLSDVYQRAKHNSQEMLAAERARATEAVKDVEVLVAKLEYEINALASKVRDVEDGVRQFELQVYDVEKRADELKVQLETESWPHWFVRCVTGIGNRAQHHSGAAMTHGTRCTMRRLQQRPPFNKATTATTMTKPACKGCYYGAS